MLLYGTNFMEDDMLNTELTPATSDRVLRSLALRTQEAGSDAFVPAPAQNDNGDEADFADKSGTYTKGILQKDVGLVDLGAYASFKNALASGNPADFEKITTGGPRTQNGPQGGLAFYLDCLDASQISVPTAPKVISEEYATELVELYWASLLRDTAFTEYAVTKVAQDAATELTGMVTYAGPRDPKTKLVTPSLLFRGPFAGETDGPYISQFLLQKTAFGALDIDQKYRTNDDTNFVLDEMDFQKVQNGIDTGKTLNTLKDGHGLPDPRYLHDGRGLAAYTHEDVWAKCRSPSTANCTSSPATSASATASTPVSIGGAIPLRLCS
jgi:hypothetical protein